jgi:predicted acyl esterase
VPAVVAAWTRTTPEDPEGFKRIGSTDKWLLVHGRNKWQFCYEQVEMQKVFFDRYLNGMKSEVDYWPKVRVEVRERYYWGGYHDYDEWPPAGTRYERLFLNALDKTMGRSPIRGQAEARYRADDIGDKTQNAQFTATFDISTELTGYMKLKLWVQADGSDDMDLFVALEKIDRSGNVVHFPFFNCWDDGPVALGWLRASHRELDESTSMLHQPFHPHVREAKLREGDIAPVEIEIWPSSTRFEPGESLRLIVQGSDIYYHPNQWPTNAHELTVNRGDHVIYTGATYISCAGHSAGEV